MKKLSVLIALMLCITISGVYATWSYAGTDDIADVLSESKITIADVELTGANGVYTIESNLVLVVDQANDNHEAELIFNSNNSQPIFLKVTFKPADNAPQNIKNNAVPSELYFGTTTPMQYKIDDEGNYSASGTPTDILKFKNVSNDELDVNISWTAEADGSFSYTLNEDDLKEQIQLSRTFVLDIKSEHDAFREALSGNIIARVTDGTVN